MAIWGEKKQGEKAKEKLIKQERIIDWFEGEGEDRREGEKMLKEQAKEVEREREEKRKEELTKRIQ